MSHPQTRPETFHTPEVTAQTPPLAAAAANAYNPTDSSYAHVFTNKATCDRNKSDAQLNAELNFMGPVASEKVPTPEHAKGLKDIHRGIDGIDSASSHLSDAISHARHGDINSALQELRNTSGDLYSAGSKVDRGATNVADLIKGDPTAQKSLNEAFKEEGKTGSHIEEAERRLRRGDVNGALRSMGRGSEEIAEESKALHHGLAQLTQDDAKTDHPQGLKDIRAAITGGDAVADDLHRAIQRTKHGDFNGALQHLRDSSIDHNNSGANLDSGAANVKDLLSTDKSARKSINSGFEAADDANFHIDKAERMLRAGDIDGALKAMNRGVENVSDEQTSLRRGLKRLKNDYAPGLGDAQPADRNDNGMYNYPSSDKGNSAWDPYESLTMPMGQYDPNAKIDRTRTPDERVRDAKRIDRLMIKE